MSWRWTFAALLLGASAPTVAAQVPDGTYLLSTYDGGELSFNDVYGLRVGSREIAVVGAYDRVIFVETTDPLSPVVLETITHPGSVWADIDSYQGYVYVVNEAGGGLQIIDATDLSNIQLVSNDTSVFSTGHNVNVDPGAGTLYVPGSNIGMPVFSLANPAAPTQLGNYTTHYVHDCTVRGGLAHLAEIYNGTYRTVDVTPAGTFTSLDSIVTPGVFTHNAYPSDDDQFVVTTDESSGGRLGIYDISNPSNIQVLGEFSSNSSAIIHNALMQGDVAHCSYYTEGYVAVDLSDPTRPKKLAQFDTWSGTDNQYESIWGCYPYQPSGVIYLTDRDDGLYCITLATQIDYAPLPDTIDDIGPYSLSATIVAPGASQTGVQAATLWYRTGAGLSYQSIPMAPGGGADEWTADIPGQTAGTTVEYYVTATDDLGQARQPRQAHLANAFSVGARSTLAFWDFESGSDEGWTHGASQGSDDWQRGTPDGDAGDPSYADSSTRCWSTDLGNSSDGEYESNTTSFLEAPAMNFSSDSGVHLRFRRWLTLRPGDEARITVDGNVVWSDSGIEDECWVTVDHDLSAFADGNSSVDVRFEMISDGSGNTGGWNIDDVQFDALDGEPPLTGILLSFSDDGTYGGVTADRSDVVRLESGSGLFSMLFDASDVGIVGNPSLDAMAILGDGSAVMSFGDDGLNVPGVGTVDDEDLVQFFPTQWGDNTSGTFAMYFDGSDVGLSATKEDVSAVSVDALGNLILSTKGPFDVGGGIVGKNEDLLEFVPSSLGASTSGTWTLIFDGNSSDVRLGKKGEQVAACHLLPATGDFVLSTGGDWRVPTNQQGEANDLLLFMPTALGSPTEGTFTVLLDGSTYGLGTANINALVYLE